MHIGDSPSTVTGEVDHTVLDAKPRYLYHFKKVLILTDEFFVMDVLTCVFYLVFRPCGHFAVKN